MFMINLQKSKGGKSMKRFVLFLFFLTGFIGAFRIQTAHSGFNFVVEEEGGQDTEDVVTPKKEEIEVEVKDDAAVTEPETMPESEQTENSTEVNKEEKTEQSMQPEEVVAEENPEEEEESEEDEEKKIYMTLNNIASTIASVKTVSYCSATFVIYNDTKKDIQEISGTIGIGDQKKKFKFSKVAPAGTGVSAIQLVGKACERIYDLPDIQVKKCQAKDMSEKKCLGRLLFVQEGTN